SFSLEEEVFLGVMVKGEKTLKKLDRIMISEAFMDKFQAANGMFLPYMISDQSLVVLWLPNGMEKRKKAFRFFNFVTDKKEFLLIVKKAWEIKIEGRMHKGRIISVCDEKEERFENDKVAEQFVKHFQEFLEVKNAMFEIEDSKAPGLDGYTARFYKSAWSIIGKDICKAVQDFFMNGKLLGEVNATLISLVPKVQNRDKVSDFRPIACCNVLYKCISKIITNRLKGVLGRLVHESQSAFIAGRHITDNILRAREVALEQFGFPNKMVKWIMVCVSTTKLSININGEREGYFNGGRGLRQGDSMSPYLFTLVMEAFNIIIRKNITDAKEFKYRQGCQKLGITHICFGDDLLVFCHGDNKSMRVIKKDLEEFSSYSDLKANMSKSTVFFGELTNAEQSSILDIIPFEIGRLPVRYLGVPLITKKINAIVSHW
nr:hypothetical protein [Tanacetum cinerariifolium]